MNDTAAYNFLVGFLRSMIKNMENEDDPAIVVVRRDLKHALMCAEMYGRAGERGV